MYYTYILECEDATLYTGVAKELANRMMTHSKKNKQSAKYTRTHTYRRVMCVWQSDNRSKAQKLEYRIKQLSRIQKLKLIDNNDLFIEYFPSLDNNDYTRIEKSTVL